jgi:ATP/maltotriose-dependent transcriptional regulator MalT
VRRHELETARVLGGEGLAVSREIGDPWFSSYFLWLLGTAALEQGDLAGARVEIEEALAVAREIDAALLLVCALEVLGRIELADGDRTAARRQLREALEISDRGDVPPSYVAAVHFALAALAGASGEPAEARAQLERSADVAHGAGDAWAEARALDALATVDSRDGPGSPQAR